MKIYYVRHGQTDLNLAKKMQGGGTEKELNETGIRQAYNTKKELENIKYDIVICSPMKRAKQTAKIINEGRNVPIIIDERIRERKLGDYEGRDVTEDMENNIWDYKLNYNIPNGENLHDFEKRVNEFFEDIKEKYNLVEEKKNECGFYKLNDLVEVVVDSPAEFENQYDFKDGYQLQKLEIILRDKKKRNLPKDKRDIEKIERYLSEIER